MSTLMVVGLDLSLTATGYAPSIGLWGVLKPAKSLSGAARLDMIERLVMTLMEPAPDLVVIEGYAYGRPNQAAHIGELGGVIRLALHRAGHVFVDVPPANLKKYATGKGNASKPDVRVGVLQRFGHDIADDNSCDAFVLRAMALDALGAPMVKMPATHRSALDKVAWPT